MADQAAGLRRLISRDFVRTIALTAARPGAGVTLVSGQLAAAATAQGRQVCLMQAEDPAFAQAGSDSGAVHAALEARRQGAEITLIDIPAASGTRQAAVAASALDVIVLLQSAQEDLRETYALMKRIVSISAKCRLHILINRSADAEYANRIFGNLSKTSDRFLSQSIQFLGDLPVDRHALGREARELNLIDNHPQAHLARMLRALAERILLWPYPGENDMSGFARRLVAALRSPTSD